MPQKQNMDPTKDREDIHSVLPHSVCTRLSHRTRFEMRLVGAQWLTSAKEWFAWYLS